MIQFAGSKGECHVNELLFSKASFIAILALAVSASCLVQPVVVAVVMEVAAMEEVVVGMQRQGTRRVALRRCCACRQWRPPQCSRDEGGLFRGCCSAGELRERAARGASRPDLVTLVCCGLVTSRTTVGAAEPGRSRLMETPRCQIGNSPPDREGWSNRQPWRDRESSRPERQTWVRPPRMGQLLQPRRLG